MNILSSCSATTSHHGIAGEVACDSGHIHMVGVIVSANKLARDSNPFSLAVDFVQTPSPYIKGSLNLFDLLIVDAFCVKKLGTCS